MRCLPSVGYVKLDIIDAEEFERIRAHNNGGGRSQIRRTEVLKGSMAGTKIRSEVVLRQMKSRAVRLAFR